MSRRIFLLFFFLLFLIFSLASQSAEKLDEILETENLSKGQACYLLGTLSGKIEDNVSFEESFGKYKDLKIFKDDLAEADIRLDEFSDLVLRNIKVKKSFLYVITKSPHYALRHLKKLNVINANKESSASISSLEALNIISKLSKQTKEKDVSEKEAEDTGDKGEQNEEE